MSIVFYKFWLILKELEDQNSQIIHRKFLASFQIPNSSSQKNVHRMEGLNSVQVFTQWPACLLSPKSLKTVEVALA
jgi:hypothetical protein